MDRIFVPVDVDGALGHVVRRARVVTETADIDLPHVVARLSIHDPLGGVFSCTASEHDAKNAETGEHVKIGQSRHRPHQTPPVRACSPSGPFTIVLIPASAKSGTRFAAASSSTSRRSRSGSSKRL